MDMDKVLENEEMDFLTARSNIYQQQVPHPPGNILQDVKVSVELAMGRNGLESCTVLRQ